MEDQSKKDIISSEANNTKVFQLDIEKIFSGDSYGLFVFKKTERLVTAIYLLTGLLSDREPLREKLRLLATDMIGSALGMSERVWGEETFQKNLLSALSEASVLFGVAHASKMISKMNYEIISAELAKLSNFLITSSSNYSSAKIAFPENMFDGNYTFMPQTSFESKGGEVSGTQISKAGSTPAVQKDIKDNTRPIEKTVMSSKKAAEKNEPVKDKNNRQEIILNMLKGGAKLTIKDFIEQIKDCSEKTIQRELASLVSKGLLKKEGERRWSKYFLS